MMSAICGSISTNTPLVKSFTKFNGTLFVRFSYNFINSFISMVNMYFVFSLLITKSVVHIRLYMFRTHKYSLNLIVHVYYSETHLIELKFNIWLTPYVISIIYQIFIFDIIFILYFHFNYSLHLRISIHILHGKYLLKFSRIIFVYPKHYLL